MINPFSDKVFKDGFSIVCSVCGGVLTGVIIIGLFTGHWTFSLIIMTVIAAIMTGVLVGAFIRYNTRIKIDEQ